MLAAATSQEENSEANVKFLPAKGREEPSNVLRGTLRGRLLTSYAIRT